MEKQNLTTGFQNVDNAQHQFLIKFLEDVAAFPVVKEGFDLQMKLLDIKEGNQVLDVGCGIGVQAEAMAKLVGEKGKVTGTDISNTMVEIAKSRTASSRLPLEFETADAIAQPFPDASFDRLRTERVLMYIQDTPKVLGEFKRLLKPGGKLVIFDFDWDAIVIPHSDKELTRRIVRYASDSFPRGRIGGELYSLMKEAGFVDVGVHPYSYAGGSLLLDITKRIYEGILQTGITNGIFSKEEIDGWWKTLDDYAKEDRLFVSFQGFIVSGSRGRQENQY